jgi:hypothetical protein
VLSLSPWRLPKVARIFLELRARLRREVGGKELEHLLGVFAAPVELGLFERFDAHRDGEYGDIAAFAQPLFVDRMRDRGAALDALVVERVADNNGVWHLHRANARRVADARPAVDHHVIVIGPHLLLDRFQKDAAAATLVEFLPVERVDPRRVRSPLAPGGQQVERAASGEVPIERNDVGRDVGV